MKLGHRTRRRGWIAILALALVATSMQAKLGLYYPEQSQAQLVSKAFKISECRLERAVPDSPMVATAGPAIVIEAGDERRAEPEFLEHTPAEPRSVLLSRSLWFRPPPARS